MSIGMSKLIRKMHKLLKDLEHIDLGGANPVSLDEKTQYTHKHMARKKKGGKAPLEFTLAEAKIDLERALQQGNWDEAIPLYYLLKRSLNL